MGQPFRKRFTGAAACLLSLRFHLFTRARPMPA